MPDIKCFAKLGSYRRKQVENKMTVPCSRNTCRADIGNYEQVAGESSRLQHAAVRVSVSVMLPHVHFLSGRLQWCCSALSCPRSNPMRVCTARSVPPVSTVTVLSLQCLH